MVVLILGFWDGSLAMGGLGLEQMKEKSERQNGQRKDLVCYCVLCVFKFEFVFGSGFVLLCSCVDI